MTFERVIIVRNPASTNARRGERYAAQLRAYFNSVEVIEIFTEPGGLAANEALLQRHAAAFGPRTLLVIIAGDGTINMVISILLQSPGFAASARQTVILPLWGGNASDLAHMLNGRPATSLQTILSTAQPIAVRPLECHLQQNKKEETRLAVCYASFGASAAAARRLGAKLRLGPVSRGVPGVRFVREMASVNRAVQRQPLFMVSEHGVERPLFEAAFFNGSRFAKVTGLPQRLSDEHFYAALVGRRGTLALLWQITKLTSRRKPERFVRSRHAFTVHDDIPAQFDGETVPIAAGTHITVGLAAQPLTFLTTK